MANGHADILNASVQQARRLIGELLLRQADLKDVDGRIAIEKALGATQQTLAALEQAAQADGSADSERIS